MTQPEQAKLHWARTSRKSHGWIDLMAFGRPVDSPRLDQPIRQITSDDIAAALVGVANLETAEAERLLADLQNGKIQEPPKVKARYVAFYCNAEDDPGMDEISREYFTANSQDAAEKLFYRKQGKETAEFLYAVVCPVEALIRELTEQAKKV